MQLGNTLTTAETVLTTVFSRDLRVGWGTPVIIGFP